MVNNTHTRLVLGFAGCGKSTAFNLLKDEYTIMDLDSSPYNWIVDANNNRVWNPKYPANYIAKIKEVYNSPNAPEFVFISPNKETINNLLTEGYPVIAVIPDRSLKEEYIKNYIARGNRKEFIDKLTRIWDELMNWLHGETRFKKTIVLQSGEYIPHKIEELK